MTRLEKTNPATCSTPASASEELHYALRQENAAVAVTILYGQNQQPAAEMVELLYCYVQNGVLSEAQRALFQQLLRTTPYRFSSMSLPPTTPCAGQVDSTQGHDQERS